MTRSHVNAPRLKILSAAGVVLVLAGLLGARLIANGAAAEPAGSRTLDPAPSIAPKTPTDPAPPLPPALTAADLPELYCWSCGSPKAPRSLDFKVDLDLLAPLGSGQANAALWMRDFARDGSRFAELEGRTVEVEVNGEKQRIFPPDDPILAEAEAWVNQATMRFYPDLWTVSGLDTPIPNLLFAIQLSRSWVSRGRLSSDPVAASEDYRRTIRLGRLIRQDRVTIIAELVAVACIRMGVEAIYDQARSEGDTATAALAAVAHADQIAIRLHLLERVSGASVLDGLEESWFGLKLHLSDERLDSVIEVATSHPERPLRLEAMLGLHAARLAGTGDQRARAQKVIEQLAESDDRHIADMARWSLAHNDLDTVRALAGSD